MDIPGNGTRIGSPKRTPYWSDDDRLDLIQKPIETRSTPNFSIDQNQLLESFRYPLSAYPLVKR